MYKITILGNKNLDAAYDKIFKCINNKSTTTESEQQTKEGYIIHIRNLSDADVRRIKNLNNVIIEKELGI